MKHFLILILTIGLLTQTHAGWFNKDQPDPTERERRIEIQTRLDETSRKVGEQQRSMTHWQIATGSLAIGCVMLLILGAALGAKVRRDGHQD